MRAHRTTNPRAVAAWVAGSFVALIAALFYRHPALYLLLIGGALVAVVAGLLVVAGEARLAQTVAEAERDSLADALAELTQRMSEARVVLPLRPTNVIPLQRDSDEWPKIARAIDIETGEPS